MSILKSKFQQAKEKQDSINERVANENTQMNSVDSNAINKIASAVSEKHKDIISKDGFSEDVKKQIIDTIEDEVKSATDDYEEQLRLAKIATSSIVGLGPIDAYMKDDTVTEIIVQQYNNICIERNGLIESINASFNDENHLRTVINRIVQPVGRQINISTPIVDARLSDGSRINSTIPPASPDGATLTIRKFPDELLTEDDYLKFGTLSIEMAAFLRKSVEAKVNLIVSGGTTAGKTTVLNVLSQYIPEDELIITIEDSCELRFKHKNLRRLEAKQFNTDNSMTIDVQALVKNALRMRPDRIIVGEIRDGTVVDMMSAMSTGHEGSMSTVHANSPEALINSRFPILYSMYKGADFSELAQTLQISEALDLIVQISKMRDGSRKITHITHVVGVENGKIKLRDIFVYNELTGEFEATGYIPKYIIDKCKRRGISISESLFKKKRAKDV
ncbi:MAG: CpaF family protein [Bacteroidales bacterium]|nr:CpaF family protein [Bacteroidales bacterium]